MDEGNAEHGLLQMTQRTVEACIQFLSPLLIPSSAELTNGLSEKAVESGLDRRMILLHSCITMQMTIATSYAHIPEVGSVSEDTMPNALQ